MRYYVISAAFLGVILSCSSNQSVKTSGGQESTAEEAADIESQGAESSSDESAHSSTEENSKSQQKHPGQIDYDSDSDGISDADENLIGTDPLVFDTNGNGISDGDEDVDGDGISNAEESDVTSSTVTDDDNDGKPDIFVPDDTDGDGLINQLDTDDDNDGINDSDEILIGTDPFNSDSDGDGIADGAEDADSDGISNGDESNADSSAATDLDGDGQPDLNVSTDSDADGIANDIDTDDDNDGVNDSDELAIGTDPLVADTDQNGVSDGDEDHDGDGLTNAEESDHTSSNPTDYNQDGDADLTNSIPISPTLGFTHITGTNQLLASDRLSSESAVDISTEIKPGERLILTKEWMKEYVFPALVEDGDTVWVALKSQRIADQSETDYPYNDLFHFGIKFYKNADSIEALVHEGTTTKTGIYDIEIDGESVYEYAFEGAFWNRFDILVDTQEISGRVNGHATDIDVTLEIGAAWLLTSQWESHGTYPFIASIAYKGSSNFKLSSQGLVHEKIPLDGNTFLLNEGILSDCPETYKDTNALSLKAGESSVFFYQSLSQISVIFTAFYAIQNTDYRQIYGASIRDIRDPGSIVSPRQWGKITYDAPSDFHPDAHFRCNGNTVSDIDIIVLNSTYTYPAVEGNWLSSSEPLGYYNILALGSLVDTGLTLSKGERLVVDEDFAEKSEYWSQTNASEYLVGVLKNDASAPYDASDFEYALSFAKHSSGDNLVQVKKTGSAMVSLTKTDGSGYLNAAVEIAEDGNSAWLISDNSKNDILNHSGGTAGALYGDTDLTSITQDFNLDYGNDARPVYIAAIGRTAEIHLDSDDNFLGIRVIDKPVHSDADKISDLFDTDDDGDGINDADELTIGSNPTLGDSDDDGIGDGFEDFDNDGILNKDESDESSSSAGSSISTTADTDNDSVSNDTDTDDDNDGINDADEVLIGLNPLLTDSDADGVSDADEDFDKDGIRNADESNASSSSFTDENSDDVADISDQSHIYTLLLYSSEVATNAPFYGLDQTVDPYVVPAFTSAVLKLQDNDHVLQDIGSGLVDNTQQFVAYGVSVGGSDFTEDEAVHSSACAQIINDTSLRNGRACLIVSASGATAVASTISVSEGDTIRWLASSNRAIQNPPWDQGATDYIDFCPNLECDHSLVSKTDTDGDGLYDDGDTDDDADGVNDSDELAMGTDPLNPDSNANGISDGDEDYDLDTISNKDESDTNLAVATDADGDGINDLLQPEDTDLDGITNDLDTDDDNDGINDTDEGHISSNPLVVDSDDNGVPDGDEDYDADGLTNAQESDANAAYATDADGDYIIDIISDL